MTELPESITRLQGLLKLQIEYNGKTSIRCAPMQISTLPCWTNTEKPYRCNWKISESLQKLKVSKFHHESIRDVSSLISKWRACNSIDLSSNEVATQIICLVLYYFPSHQIFTCHHFTDSNSP
eukprot:TRINITY_DN10732_c0_g1_i13.p1 TRINITY_DN10732_c0_g1~~TRINITY_DN10732_c0_g1_i13.p1  ORF type:complete len:123 (+),score=18.03 TRINITY_DN10732_c0_g1_i13:874-1242(+)